MTEKPIKIHLDSSTYITKVNGRLVTVRERREKLLDVCMDLLGEAFGKFSRPKMKEDSEKPEGENGLSRNVTRESLQNFPTPPVFNPDANLVGPPTMQSIMGPMGPQPGIYRFGNRQLALVPLNPQGGPAMAPHMGYPCPQPPWMFPQGSNMGGFNYPPMGTDPQQFIADSVPPRGVRSEASVAVTKHVCAECGRLRSRKYQRENPLKPGETPTPAFCKKCQKDVTSTEESDTSIRNTKKQHKRSNKGSKKKYKSESDTNSSKESIDSDETRKVSKPKQKKGRNKLWHEYIIPEDQPGRINHRPPRTYPQDDTDYIPSREQSSPFFEEAPSRRSVSTNSSPVYREDSATRHPRTNYQAQGSSMETVATDAAEEFYHSRRAQPRSRYETYETGRAPKPSRSNEDTASLETATSKGRSSEESTIRTSRTRSEEASRRRRLERSIGEEGFGREATGLLHGIHPLEDEEVVVVTERYVYRPRPLSHVQEEDMENRRHDLTDKATVRAENPSRQFAAEAEAANYYRNDWSGVSERDKVARQQIRPRSLEGLIAPADSQTSNSSSSSRYKARNDIPYQPRAPSSPRPLHEGDFHSQIDLPHHDALYSLSEDEDVPSRRNKGRTSSRDREIVTQRCNRNGYRRPYVREATERGTERALMPSPRHSRERLFYPDNTSESTEEMERVERHVTFHDSDAYDGGYAISSGKPRSARILEEERRR